MVFDCLPSVCRYDGRGHLYDLRPYDADLRKGLPAPDFTEDEKNMEKLCDEERYLELHTDLAEKAMYEGILWSFGQCSVERNSRSKLSLRTEVLLNMKKQSNHHV